MPDFFEWLFGNSTAPSGSDNKSFTDTTGSGQQMTASDLANLTYNSPIFGHIFTDHQRDIIEQFGQLMDYQPTEYEEMKGHTDSILSTIQDKANKGDMTALEMLFNYYATKESELNARQYTAEREDTAYQRLIKDLQAAGLSPYVLSGAAPMSMASTSKTYNSSAMASRENNKRTTDANMEKTAIQSLLSFLGIVIGAIAMMA